MQNDPRIFNQSPRGRSTNGYEPRETPDTGATLWLAAAAVILMLAALTFFGDDNLRNGGAPFIISPAAQTAGSQPAGL